MINLSDYDILEMAYSTTYYRTLMGLMKDAQSNETKKRIQEIINELKRNGELET